MTADPAPRLTLEHVTRSIIGAFFELLGRGHDVQEEVSVRVYYKREPIAWHRLDMVVDGSVVVEIKAGVALPPNASRQLVN